MTLGVNVHNRIVSLIFCTHVPLYCGLTKTFHQFYFYSTIGKNSLVTPAQFQPHLLLISMWCISEKDCSILKQYSALNADLW